MEQDVIHAHLAAEALGQFWAAFRGITDKETREALAMEIAKVTRDAAETVTGKRDLPVIVEDEF